MFKLIADEKPGPGSFLGSALTNEAMIRIVWLYYALLIVLYPFDRLELLRLVRVECGFVCCHVFSIRMLLTPSQQSPDGPLRAVAISVRTPYRLIAAMKPSTVARCAVANEYLRRRKQPCCDATNRGRPNHHVKLLSVTFEDVSHDGSRKEQRLMESSQPLRSPTVREHCCTETGVMRIVALDRTSEATMHSRKSSVWVPTTKRQRTSSAVLLALQPKTDRNAPTAPTVADVDDQDIYLEEPISNECSTATQASQDMAKQEYPILTTFRFPPSGDDCTSKISVRSTHSEVSSDTASPTSDATLFEDAPLCPVSPSGCGEDFPDCTDHNDILGKRLSAKCANQVKDYEPTPMSRRYVRHCRHISSSSAVDVAETLPTSLRSRAKTNDGLFLFRANPFKEPTANVHRGRHRQRISLNLPVNSHAGQRSGTQQSRQPDTEDLTQPLVGDEAAYPATKSDTWPAEERDLEYKHRHTFIGTASLDDFIEILEISKTHTTTKGAVARAFVQLASAEQLYARQCSTRNNGWELITPTSLTVMDVTSVDYIVQLRVKLGSITLRQFLDLIPFDEDDEAAAVHVVEAFSIASHMDTTAAIGTISKAKAFRSWLVEQMKVDAGH